ncbi:MAG: SRPBCC domain-containing protein [Dehalococcoidia bacterium]
MATTTAIGLLAVRRAIWIDAAPERVWQEFESLDRMKRWYGTGHTLVEYQPRVGAMVKTDAGGDELRFEGRVVVYDPPRELTFEQDWRGKGWTAPALVTLRLTPHIGGTVVELFHHGFERMGAAAGEIQRGFEGGWTTRQLEALREIAEA